MKKETTFNPVLAAYIEKALSKSGTISEERQQQLQELASYIKGRIHSGETVRLNFICTHNSRRSHLSQIWAATAAAYHQLEGINTYSGGTEATAFNPRAVEAIKRAGFSVQNPGGNNPHYLVSFADGSVAMECFSKTYDDTFNPKDDFVAVMTCSEADKGCPFIPGAALRVPIRYNDPKEADDTPEEQTRYDERCLQIAIEMLYLMGKVKS